MDGIRQQVQGYFGKVTQALRGIEEGEMQKVLILLRAVRAEQGTVWLVGNGGSASTAAHIANDLWKACGIFSVALAEQGAVVTAYGNDCGWQEMFREAMRGRVGPNDALWAISCSGNSENVLRATGMVAPDRLILMTGLITMDNAMDRISCYAKLKVPSNDIRVVEDAHLSIGHCLVGLIGKGG